MLVLGLQGSPRKNGNSAILLARFMEQAKKHNAETVTLDVADMNIKPCVEYTTCEKTGKCPIKDDVETIVFPLLRRADIVIVSAPVFFYGVPAQLKALIDRTQILWSRKYRLKLNDPGKEFRRGFLLSVAASQGKKLFDGIELTTKYFFDAANIEYEGKLVFRGIFKKGDTSHKIEDKVLENTFNQLIVTYKHRKKIKFICRDGSFLSPAANVFARTMAGNIFDIEFGGTKTSGLINTEMIRKFEGLGMDAEFLKGHQYDLNHFENEDEIIIYLSSGEIPDNLTDYIRVWNLPDPENEDNHDEILSLLKKKVTGLIEKYKA